MWEFSTVAVVIKNYSQNRRRLSCDKCPVTRHWQIASEHPTWAQLRFLQTLTPETEIYSKLDNSKLGSSQQWIQSTQWHQTLTDCVWTSNLGPNLLSYRELNVKGKSLVAYDVGFRMMQHLSTSHTWLLSCLGRLACSILIQSMHKVLSKGNQQCVDIRRLSEQDSPPLWSSTSLTHN